LGIIEEGYYSSKKIHVRDWHKRRGTRRRDGRCGILEKRDSRQRDT
jgi:hypothetical protein